LGNFPFQIHAGEESDHDGAQDHEDEERGDKGGGFVAEAVCHGLFDRIYRINGIFWVVAAGWDAVGVTARPFGRSHSSILLILFILSKPHGELSLIRLMKVLVFF
jgi:hypothetical protein